MPVILKGSEGEEGNNYDLGLSTSIEDSLIHELLTAYEDKKISLMDLYAHFYSPCKVSDPGLTVKGTGDMTDVMVDFSEGYEKFIKSLGDEYVNYMIRRRSCFLSSIRVPKFCICTISRRRVMLMWLRRCFAAERLFTEQRKRLWRNLHRCIIRIWPQKPVILSPLMRNK